MEVSNLLAAKAIMVEQMFAGNLEKAGDAAAKTHELVAKEEPDHRVASLREPGKGEHIDILA